MIYNTRMEYYFSLLPLSLSLSFSLSISLPLALPPSLPLLVITGRWRDIGDVSCEILPIFSCDMMCFSPVQYVYDASHVLTQNGLVSSRVVQAGMVASPVSHAPRPVSIPFTSLSLSPLSLSLSLSLSAVCTDTNSPYVWLSGKDTVLTSISHTTSLSYCPRSQYHRLYLQVHGSRPTMYSLL